MSCNCLNTTTTPIQRRYMRVDSLIFDKKYVSKLVFDGNILYLYYKGDCHPLKYEMDSEKSIQQIAEYQLELNTCSDTQVDMSTDDHSKLINLDIEDQHPIKAIAGLQDELDNKFNKEFSFWIKSSLNDFEYLYYGELDPSTINLDNGKNVITLLLDVLNNIGEYPNITENDLSVLKLNKIVISSIYNGKNCFLYSGENFVFIGYSDIYYDLNTKEKIVLIKNNNVVDNLNNDSVDLPLSAKQGKELNTKISDIYTILNTKVDTESFNSLKDDVNDRATLLQVNNLLYGKQDKIVDINYTDLPDPSINLGRIFHCQDIGALSFSNGKKWLKIKLEDF